MCTPSRASAGGGVVPCAASTATATAQSRTERAIGPAWSRLFAYGMQPSSGTVPKVGFMPTTPHRLAGTRTDPPVSVPGARSTRPVATATADPVDEPPAVRPGA